VRRATSRLLGVFLVLQSVILQSVIGCTSESPIVVPATSPVAPTPVPAPAPTPPPLPPPSPDIATYVRVMPSTFNDSRYVFYADSTFSLRYVQLGAPYRGRFARTDSTVKLSFSYGPWVAVGIVRGDSTLTVTYNDIMVGSDFEDGVYWSAAPLPASVQTSGGLRR
jgi:hypothetical protein